jgi:hypothetical protein
MQGPLLLHPDASNAPSGARLAAQHYRIFSLGPLLMFIRIHEVTCKLYLFRFWSKHDLTFAIPETDKVFPLNEPFDAYILSNLSWATMELDLFLDAHASPYLLVPGRLPVCPSACPS